MNIGIDINCLVFEKAGVGEYARQIVTNLLKIDKKNHYFLYGFFLRRKKERLAQIKHLLPPAKNMTIKIVPLPARWYELLSSTPFPITKIIKEPLDVYFSPYAAGIPKNGFAKMVVTIHDLVFLRFPEHRGKKLSNYYLKRHKIAVRNSQKIIAPSRATKDDIAAFLKVNRQKIQVIAEAADRRFRKITNRRAISQVVSRYISSNKKYILAVGTLEPRKNLVKLARAYALLPLDLQNEHQLVLVGARGWGIKPLLKIIANLNLKDKVTITGFASDDDLPYIYNGASIFVYPSLFEGFGLPPLEAMACGAPVITARNSSLPEVVGKAAVLVDAQKEEEIAAAMRKVLADDKLRQKLIGCGRLQTRKFSWGKAARETLRILEM